MHDHANHTPTTAAPAADPRRRLILLSLALSVVMLVGKLSSYFLTHSVALLSDAAESVVHGVATGLAAFSFWYAAQPADPRHPYGHGRIAYFSAGFEGALVFSAAIVVLWQGIVGLLRPQPLSHLGVGVAISITLMTINLALGLSLIRVGRKHHSVVLVANGTHVLSDVWTTAAALIGILLVMATGLQWLDGLAAVVLGAVILIGGLRLMREAAGGLMDEADPGLIERVVAPLQAAVRDGRISAFHQLRCRQVNDTVLVEVHMLLPGELPLDSAHARVTSVEQSLLAAFAPRPFFVTTHIEPLDHERAHPGGHENPLDPLTPHSTRNLPLTGQPT